MRVWSLIFGWLCFVALAALEINATNVTMTFDGTTYANQTGQFWNQGGFQMNGGIIDLSFLTVGPAPNRVVAFTFANTASNPYIGALGSNLFAIRYLEYWQLPPITILGIRNHVIVAQFGITPSPGDPFAPHAVWFPTNGSFDCLDTVQIIPQNVNDVSTVVMLDNILLEPCTGSCPANGPCTGWPSVIMRPTAAFTSPSTRDLFYRRSDNTIEHLTWTSTSSLSSATSYNLNYYAPLAPHVAGNEAYMYDGAEKHVFYRDAAGQINHIWWSNPMLPQWDQWTVTTAAPLAGSDPAALYDSLRSEQHMFYRGRDNEINHILWNGNALYKDQWTVRAQAPLASGVPAALFDGYNQHVFYRGTDGHINHIWWNGTGLSFDRWTYLTGAPLAAGDPVVILANTDQNVFYRDVNGDVQRIWWNGNVLQLLAWTGPLTPGKPVGDISAMYTGTELHIVFRTPDNSTAQIWQSGNNLLYNYWATGATYPAEGDPTFLWTGFEQNVFFEDTSGYLHHCWYASSVVCEVWPIPV